MPGWAIALTIWLALSFIAAFFVCRAIWIADKKQREDNSKADR